MMAGALDNWEEITVVPVISKGEHSLYVHEGNTNVTTTEEFILDHEMWIVIAFHGPKIGFKVQFLDQPVAFMWSVWQVMESVSIYVGQIVRILLGD